MRCWNVKPGMSQRQKMGHGIQQKMTLKFEDDEGQDYMYTLGHVQSPIVEWNITNAYTLRLLSCMPRISPYHAYYGGMYLWFG